MSRDQNEWLLEMVGVLLDEVLECIAQEKAADSDALIRLSVSALEQWLEVAREHRLHEGH